MALKDGDCIKFVKGKYEETLDFHKSEQTEIFNWKQEKLTL
ncbi:unnamed protein product, partial [marine sediment metagenome]